MGMFDGFNSAFGGMYGPPGAFGGYLHQFMPQGFATPAAGGGGAQRPAFDMNAFGNALAGNNYSPLPSYLPSAVVNAIQNGQSFGEGQRPPTSASPAVQGMWNQEWQAANPQPFNDFVSQIQGGVGRQILQQQYPQLFGRDI